jgi:hypothetical protein
MIDWNQIQWGSAAQWISAIATFSAVSVALFKEGVLARLRRPKLTMRAHHGPPDSDKIPFVYKRVLNSVEAIVPGLPPIPTSADSYFLRLWIQNDGKSRAEKVQVFAARLFRKTKNNRFELMGSFLPMNLRWGFGSETPTHAETFADGISPGMGVHCILAHVIDPAHRKEIGEDHPEAKPGQTVLCLETELKSTSRCHILAPGTYHLELLIAGANCRPTSHTIELTLTGEWFAERERMLREGVMMRVLPETSAKYLVTI